MLNQLELIEAARVAIAQRENKPEPVSYYRVSKELGFTSAYMSRLREGGYIMSTDAAHKLARLAGIDPAYAMACIEAERAARDELETTGTWRAIADALAARAAAVVGAVIMAAMLAHSESAQASTYTRASAAVRTVDLYIMRSRVALHNALRNALCRVAATILDGLRHTSQRVNCAPVPCPA